MEVRADFESLIPPLSPDEFQQLEENCIRDGIRDPLVTWNDVLIDGHNRYKIAQEHNLEYQVASMDFPDEMAAKMWVIENQLGRRNVTPYDRCVLALKLKPEVEARAKANQQKAGGAVPQKSAKAVDTRDELAKIAAVSHDTISKVERIENEAPESIKQAVRVGKMSINQAYNTTCPKRGDPIGKAKKEHEQFQISKATNKVLNMADIQMDKCNKNIINVAMYADLLKLLEKILRYQQEYANEFNESQS